MPTQYSDQVLKAVAGSGADQTWSADVAPLAAKFMEFVAKLKVQDPLTGAFPSYTIDRDDPMVSDLIDAAVKLGTVAYVADTAINGLAVYSDKAFYTEVIPMTKAAEDQGTHASWVLRMVVPGAT